MTETGQGGIARRRLLIWGAAIVAGIVLLGGGAFAVSGLLRSGNASTAAPAPSTAPSGRSPSPTPRPAPGENLAGPLNILLAGIDTRITVPGWVPHSDAVLIMHITKDLDRAYLFSLPRDLLVDVPAFPKSDFSGRRTKLTHAMSYGSRVPGKPKSPSTSQGFELLSATASRYIGIPRFDAGAVLTFQGFDRLVDALGGVDLTVDQRVVSLHRRPDGKHRTPGTHGYYGPQMVYEKGRHHFVGWQALDYARQRYIAGGDYARQRHQQQLIKAILTKILSQDLARDEARVTEVVKRLGKTLTFQGRGQRVVDFAFALGRIPPSAITLVELPGRAVGGGSGYRGEQLDPIAARFFRELRAGRADAFLAANPRLVTRS